MSKEKNKIFVSCGEMSGDLHLSYVIEEMKNQDPKMEFYGVVGDKSIAAGATEVNHIKNNDIMGFIEAVKKYRYFRKKAREYLRYIEDNDIKTVIFVDFGGFNLKFFELIKKSKPDIKTIYYIPPKVWAWGKKRIKKLKLFDEVIVIFPFEKKYFDDIENKSGLHVEYFGNPLVDKYDFSEKTGNKILLLPGSRKQEIMKFVPVILEFVQKKDMMDERFILKLAHEDHLKYIEELEKKDNFRLNDINNIEISYEKIEILRNRCKYAIATSGTVTFELALMGLPVIAVYKTSPLNAFIAKKILKIDYISLTNLNAEKEIFPELLQDDFSAENLLIKCKEIEEKREHMTMELKKERKRLGNKGVLRKIAHYLLKNIT